MPPQMLDQILCIILHHLKCINQLLIDIAKVNFASYRLPMERKQ